ncbi:M81 family metallopeptidase [Paracoccus sp. p4-l81]|uniref:M81 family metallopeptidase n=1 Tax=Paracoccus sp. p4-l81 TaxID=3342806 RepID=UPI0035BB426A
MRVAIGGIHTEASSYSPLWQRAGDFRRTTGDALVAMAGVDFAAHGITPIPIFHDRATPGGPVDPAVFAAQKAAFLDGLRAAMPLDGVLLILHGAYFVPGVDDPEGDLITAIRDLVGPGAIISSAWDLHGQITDRITGAVDAFAAFRTAPHTDQAETRARAARMLIQALSGGPRPQVVRVPVPILVPGEMSSTWVEPCRSLYAGLAGYDARSGICDANLMIGYAWADSPRAGACAVVTCTDPEAGLAVAHSIARDYRAARDRLDFDMETAPLDILLDRLAADPGPATLADSGDNPTAGGVGDRADVLAALIARGWSRPTIIAGIAAPKACAALAQGARVVTVGGDLGGGGPRVTLCPEGWQAVGDLIVARLGAIRLVLCAGRRPFHDLADFAALGLEVAGADLLVVKSGYLSPDLHALPRRAVMALTDGAVCQNLTALDNHHRPRPMWPFDQGLG